MSRLLETFATIPADELARAAAGLSRMSPTLLQRVVRVLASPQVARLIR